MKCKKYNRILVDKGGVISLAVKNSNNSGKKKKIKKPAAMKKIKRLIRG